MVKSASLFIKADDEKVWSRYQHGAANLTGDAGFDLYVPESVTFRPLESRKVSMGVACMMRIHREKEPDFWRSLQVYIVWLWTNIFAGIVTIFPCMQEFVPKVKPEPEDPITSFLIYPRSSIANTPLRLSNSVGVVDSGYRGPIMAALYNTSDKPFILDEGTRIIQLCAPGLKPFRSVIRVAAFEETARGSRGFGSTGGTGCANQ